MIPPEKKKRLNPRINASWTILKFHVQMRQSKGKRCELRKPPSGLWWSSTQVTSESLWEHLGNKVWPFTWWTVLKVQILLDTIMDWRKVIYIYISIYIYIYIIYIYILNSLDSEAKTDTPGSLNPPNFVPRYNSIIQKLWWRLISTKITLFDVLLQWLIFWGIPHNTAQVNPDTHYTFYSQ